MHIFIKMTEKNIEKLAEIGEKELVGEMNSVLGTLVSLGQYKKHGSLFQGGEIKLKKALKEYPMLFSELKESGISTEEFSQRYNKIVEEYLV